MIAQPEAQYRVSVKAFVQDAEGRILLNKENGHAHFSLPGGGVEHGETMQQALVRELHEELGVVEVFSATFKTVQTFHSLLSDKWMMWVVYDVTCALESATGGSHSEEIRWYYPNEIDGSTTTGELIRNMIK